MSLNLSLCVMRAAQAVPDHTALVFNGERWNYRQLAASVQRVAAVLLGRGLSPGGVVALMLANTPLFPMCYYGGLYAGLTIVPMNPALRPREILAMLEDAGVDAIIAEQECLEAVREAAALGKGLSAYTIIGAAEIAACAGGNSGEEAVPEIAPTAPGDVAVIIYAYGVPDRFCAAELTHFNLYQNAMACKDDALVYYPNDIFLSVLPLFHGFGQTSMMNAPFLAQSTVVFSPRFDAPAIMRLIESERVTVLALVPTMLQLFLSARRTCQADLSSVRVVASGGSALPVDLAQRFMDAFGIPVLEGYGLTETSPVVSFNRPDDHRLGTLGKPLRGCEVAIMRPDGAFAATGETGEIVIRGDFVMKGYHGQPDETAKAMAGGWFHTRDLGFYDRDGYLHFAGLIKDLIITSGMNVSPREVESVLRAHPAVADAAVIGCPDALRGQIAVAFIVPRKDITIGESDLAAHCREWLAPYKRPRRWVFTSALPKDDTGKLRKDLLRVPMAQETGRPESG